MLYKEISRVIGKYLFYFSFTLFVPLIISLYYEFIEGSPFSSSYIEFIITIVISFAISGIFYLFGKKAKGIFYRKESILIVVLIWLLSAFIGGMPFYLTKTLSNPIDAYFEAMSGFTTTGASVMCAKKYDSFGHEIPITEKSITSPIKSYKYYGTISPVYDAKTKVTYTGVEAVNRGILFWRSFIQWLGGMGIVVLFIAILPALAIGGKFLYETEVPGPTKDTLAPRIKETSSILWKLYLGLTILQIYLLIWTNHKMPLFDAFCITFSTLSTGGFSILNNSIGGYNNVATDWIVIIFMIAGSINFVLYFQIIRKKFYKIYEPDFLLFLGLIILSSIVISVYITGQSYVNLDGSKGVYTVSNAIRNGAFQAVSAQTSTGFVTTDYDYWPFMPQMFMLLLMFIGGMAGSTAGGIKTSRYLILFKIIIHKIESIFRPDEVKKLRLGMKDISLSTSVTVLAFFSIVIFFAILGAVLLIVTDLDPITAIGTITCMMNNIGMAFKATGPGDSFAVLSIGAKIVSIIWMLLGRLEYFAVLLLFIPAFWQRN